ncbi:putative immunoglobulin-blocking virulence protein, partial [Mycoplasma flocculare]|uniref:putative immunoglobulin-blocking virulence protein n=1 Tax=Mesomycoplasma flocculare TaxID=2128 RepID=UPI001368086E
PSFYSPVTNSEFKPFENKKPKVDLINPEIKPEIKKEIEKPEIKEPEKKEEAADILTAPTVIKKSQTEEIPKKVEQPTPAKEPAKPVNAEYGYVTLDWSGLKVRAYVKKKPNRQYSSYDISNGISNRIPYHAQVVDEVISVEVTPELLKKNTENAATALRNSFQGGAFNIDSATIQQGDQAVAAVVAQNWQNYYKNMFFKWRELFENGDKVKDFLTQEGQQKYPDIKSKYQSDLQKAEQAIATANAEMDKLLSERPPRTGFDQNGHETFTDENKIKLRDWQVKFNDAVKKQEDAKQLKEDAKNTKYAKLIYYLDYSKFVRSSKENDDYLSKGFTINTDNSNISVDENGTLRSNSWSPLINQVTSVYQKDNETRRAFGYGSYWSRPGGNILDGTYEGWTKKDITNSEEYKKYNVSKSDGINISELTKNADNKANTTRNKGIVVTIDFSNQNGYSKTKKLIQDLANDRKEITSYRFFHIGKNDANQKFKDILEILPENLPQLELLFDSTNTSALLALENKKIDELSIYTEGNSLSDDWAINPWALKNTAWYNSNDYNVSFDYAPGAKVATRITFNSLAFDDSDYTGNNDFTRINNGLRMAYWTRNNEKVFQGGWGPGLNPDVNESENSYPTGLDLTRVTKMKSLKGLIFYDTQKSSNAKSRRLTRIGLYNNNVNFEISADELNQAQFNVLDTNPRLEPKPKIFFSNDSNTKRVKITGQNLSSEGANNLRILLENGRQKKDNTLLFNDKRIIIDKNNSSLKNSLESQGFQVDESGTSGITFS